MQNLMIIDNDIFYINKIINIISDKVENVKLYKFFLKTEEEILKCLNNKAADIIIVNMDLYGKGLIEYIIENKLKLYKKSIILLYKDISKVKEFLKKEYEEYIFRCIKISENIEVLVKNLRLITRTRENKNEYIIRDKIERNLVKIGFRLKSVGTKYIIESVEYLYKNNIEKFKLNDIYNMLAIKHNKPFNTIKGAVTRANKSMNQYCNKDIIIDFFNYMELVEMPTITEIIMTLYEKL